MKKRSRSCSVVCVIAAGAFSASASATDEAAPTAGLEEIVVTAEKRQERAIDVPISITAVNTQDLANQDLEQLQDYYSRIPGLQFNGSGTSAISLRGITTGGGTNPTVAILLDDVPFGGTIANELGNSHFPDFDPAMFERIEVLRGPQGTLYGASSLGGLIKFVTNQPDTTTLSGRVETGFESTEGGDIGYTTRASVNLPIVSDMVGVRVSTFLREDPAWIDNVANSDPTITVTPGQNVNRAKTYGGHVALLVKPVDGLSITLSALDQRRNARFFSGVLVNEDPNGYPLFNSPTYGHTDVSLGPTSDIGRQQLFSGRVEAELPLDMHFTSITAYSRSGGTNYQDVTSTFGGLFNSFYGESGPVSIADAAQTEKFSEEMRLAGKLSQLDWRLGLFYTREAGSVDQTLFYNPVGAPVVPYQGLGPATYKERAAFADGTYHFTSQWELQAGVRWSQNRQVDGSSQVIDATVVPVFGPTATNADIRSTDNSTTWAVSPTYHITPDMMTYLRVATGYRPGGPNTAVTGIPPTYGPDRVTNYEIGLKGLAVDKTISYDLSVFDIEWKDIQLQNTDAVTEFVYTLNGGKARSRGLEAQASWQPLKGLEFAGNMTFTDATLSEALPLRAETDTLLGQAGDRLPGTARFTSNLSVQDTFPLGDGLDGFVGGNWSYIGTRYSAFQLLAPDPTDPSVNTTTPRFTIPGYSLIDLQAGLQWNSLRATGFLRNAFNSNGVIWADNRNGTSVTSVTFLQPRTVGMTVSYQF